MQISPSEYITPKIIILNTNKTKRRNKIQSRKPRTRHLSRQRRIRHTNNLLGLQDVKSALRHFTERRLRVYKKLQIKEILDSWFK